MASSVVTTQEKIRGKVMAGIFWDSKGYLLVEFLEVDATTNSKQYGQTLKKSKQRM
jgi:hypothetical protein